jgi:hypothetical protein
MTVRAELRRAKSAAQTLTSLGRRLNRLEVERDHLAAQVLALQEATQELRGLGGRVSELADVVTELLAVEATRADPEFQRLVERYRRGV